MAEAYRKRFEKRDLNVQVLIAAEARPLRVQGDERRLRQLLGNLLENSLRYTGPAQPVRISLEREGDNALLHIEDGPPGVPTERCEQLFERFYREEASRSRQHGGAGLGLAICRNIALAHHGEIRAQRSELGGLRVEVRLPLQRHGADDGAK